MVIPLIIKEEKRQKYFLVTFLIIVLITFLILWQGFFKKGKIVPVVEVLAPREIKINFEVLEKPALKELKLLEKISPFEETIGMENPFLSY